MSVWTTEITRTVMRYTGLAVLAAALLLPVTDTAWAQAEPQAAPGRVPQMIDRPDLRDTVEPGIPVPSTPDYRAPDGAERVRFTLNGIQIDGMSVFTQQEVMGVFNPYLSTEISLADVYKMANTLMRKYRARGYILTQVVVPAQRIRDGVPKIRVVEGFIDQVTIEGDVRGGLAQIRKYARNIGASDPLNVADLERYLLLINDLPGIEARSVLSPSTTTAGAANLKILVNQDRYFVLAQVDNRGSRYLGPIQTSMVGQGNSMLGQHEALGVQLLAAPDDWAEMAYGSVYYTQPVGDEGTTIEASASYTETEPGFNLTQFDVEGDSLNLDIKARHPFIRSRTKNASGYVQFSYANINREDNLPTAEVKDRIRALRVGGTFENTDNVFGDRFIGVNVIKAEVSQGIPIFGETDTANPTRARGSDTFTKLELEVTRLQRLSRQVELYMGLSGQKSATTLLASEEFGIGGERYGRAYDNSELVGEDGLIGIVELRYTPDWQAPWVDGYQLYTFYDVGRVWNRDTFDSHSSLASAGGGVRVDINENVFGSLELAVPLTRDKATEFDQDLQVFGRLTYRRSID